MNLQLKILLYILVVIGLFYYIQREYSLFDISFDNVGKEKKEDDVDKNSVEILNSEQKSILVEVELADTVELKRIGLSGREYLGDYQGMLFFMDYEDIHPFWMKDMLIPLDMLFINSEGIIVEIFDNQQPCAIDFCPSIVPSNEFKYVLEVKSGFAQINRVEVGNAVIFNISSED